MSSAITWRTYTAVLTHLRSSTQPPSVLQALLAHHLASPPAPTPTPLAAASVSSPYFLTTPHSYDHIQAFETAYRQAVHLCYKTLDTGLLTPSKQTQLLQWVSHVLSGLKNGNAILRLAACAGLLLGLQDMEAKSEQQLSGHARNKLEDDVVLALAECLDFHSAKWVEEHGSDYPRASLDPLFLSLILASHIHSHIPRQKLAALPLPLLSKLLATSIWHAFRGGRVLSEFLDNVAVDEAGRVSMESTTVATSSLSVTADPLYGALPSLCRFLSLTLTMSLSASKADLATSQSVLEIFDDIATHANLLSWLDSKRDADIEPSARPLTANFFGVVKTLLFCIVMVADAVMAHAVYVKPSPTSTGPAPPHSIIPLANGKTLSSNSAASAPSYPPTPAPSPHATLCLTLLRTLARLAPAKATFPELARALYAALDVIAADDRGAASILVLDIASPASNSFNRASSSIGVARNSSDSASAPLPPGFKDAPPPASPSRTAFSLTIIEQLVPVLTLRAVEAAWGFVAQHLSDPSSRQVYEAAHSAALALFDAFAPGEGDKDKEEKAAQTGFVARLVPYYAQCLIENSAPSHLNLAQLRHAYAMVMRCAGAHDDALAMYCVQRLLDALHEDTIGAHEATHEAHHGTETIADSTPHKQRLRLTLASTVSCVPVSLLPRVLDKLKSLATEREEEQMDGADPFTLEERVALRDAIFEEITERVGNTAKEYAVRWWYANRGVFPPLEVKGREAEGEAQDKEGKPLAQL